jgi:hypothetical protein
MAQQMISEQYTDSSTLHTNELYIKQKKVIGWYCIGRASFINTNIFPTYYKPNLIKRFLMRTLLDFYWIKETNK